jgi:hypothetical protein
MAKEALNLADIYIGGKAPRQGAAQVVEPLRNVVEGATYEAGGRGVRLRVHLGLRSFDVGGPDP